MATLFETHSRVHRSAELSDCGLYRYWLRRAWQEWRNGELVPDRGVCCFVMLNPSKADAIQDDPTITRCIGFARAWGYHTLTVRNLFALRATDPAELKRSPHPTVGGNRNEQELLAACTADLLVAAWGAGVPRERDKHVLTMWRSAFPEKLIHCLGVTRGGYPRHPLYVRADAQPVLFEP